MNRYNELLKLVRLEKPKNILEVGTWNGNRAIELCQFGASYTGFDLFEEATSELDVLEKNVKNHNSLKAVRQKLKRAGIKASLVKGNTNESLPEFVASSSEKFDFAFIDGGHSVDTIRNDWENVKQLMYTGALVVFDDYYENCYDLDTWGANSVIENLNYTLGDSIDPVITGERVRLALVRV